MSETQPINFENNQPTIPETTILRPVEEIFVSFDDLKVTEPISDAEIEARHGFDEEIRARYEQARATLEGAKTYGEQTKDLILELADGHFKDAKEIYDQQLEILREEAAMWHAAIDQQLDREAASALTRRIIVEKEVHDGVVAINQVWSLVERASLELSQLIDGGLGKQDEHELFRDQIIEVHNDSLVTQLQARIGDLHKAKKRIDTHSEKLEAADELKTQLFERQNKLAAEDDAIRSLETQDRVTWIVNEYGAAEAAVQLIKEIKAEVDTTETKRIGGLITLNEEHQLENQRMIDTNTEIVAASERAVESLSAEIKELITQVVAQRANLTAELEHYEPQLAKHSSAILNGAETIEAILHGDRKRVEQGKLMPQLESLYNAMDTFQKAIAMGHKQITNDGWKPEISDDVNLPLPSAFRSEAVTMAQERELAGNLASVEQRRQEIREMFSVNFIRDITKRGWLRKGFEAVYRLGQTEPTVTDATLPIVSDKVAD